MTLTVGSLFSGIGGLELGLERAGMTVRWQVEIDDWCRLVLAKHWPAVTRYTDIKNVDWTEVEPVDLVCGGFPCQPVSLAGKRLAQDDPRWLWPEFARCLRALRPRFALMENTTGLLSAGMGDVLGDLAALGYDAEWDCIPAAAVGARHIRNRVCLVAYPIGERLEGRDGRAEDGWGQQVLRVAPSTPRSLRWDITEPAVCRAIEGIPARVDRLRGLGNAVVPQVAEWVGRRIVEIQTLEEES
jgi:DNA (cytosine-5)-methyltransferase 1